MEKLLILEVNQEISYCGQQLKLILILLLC